MTTNKCQITTSTLMLHKLLRQPRQQGVARHKDAPTVKMDERNNIKPVRRNMLSLNKPGERRRALWTSMPVWCALVVSLVLASFPWTTTAQAAKAVEGVRVWQGPDNTRIVFDISHDINHKLFTLPNPNRVVIDFPDTRFSASLKHVDFSGTAVRAIRTGVRKGDDLRVVLDLREEVSPKSILLRPNREYGYRVVVDLDLKQPRPVRVVAPTKPEPKKAAPSRVRDIVVAIDAGHGGEDPGARGPRGTREKDVVLAISDLVAQRINKEPGIRAVLVRTGDYYIGLRKRIDIAREHQADLFVSIHADAFPDHRARGSSVYTLSANGASSEAARWLADRENAADLVGGVSLEDKDDLLASVLLDLAQTATNEASVDVADMVLRGLKDVGTVHKSRVQHASFVVLKSPDIPSILIETAFISNHEEEKKLRSSAHQREMANAIFDGIKRYFTKYPPPDTVLAQRRRHVIERGDTLAKIAQRYHISISQLRNANKLTNDRIRPGQVLQIPTARDS